MISNIEQMVKEYDNSIRQTEADSAPNAVDTTIQYYEELAEEFAANTLDADMKSIRSRFLAYLPVGG